MILGFGGGVDGGCSRMEISRLKRLAGTKHAQQALGSAGRWVGSLRLGIICIVCLILMRRSRLGRRDLKGQGCFAVGGREAGAGAGVRAWGSHGFGGLRFGVLVRGSRLGMGR